jgi:hypothetical protein
MCVALSVPAAGASGSVAIRRQPAGRSSWSAPRLPSPSACAGFQRGSPQRPREDSDRPVHRARRDVERPIAGEHDHVLWRLRAAYSLATRLPFGSRETPVESAGHARSPVPGRRAGCWDRTARTPSASVESLITNGIGRMLRAVQCARRRTSRGATVGPGGPVTACSVVTTWPSGAGNLGPPGGHVRPRRPGIYAGTDLPAVDGAVR